MSGRIDVSVVISSYNGDARLPAALHSVLHQDAGDVSYEVVVVDNNSNDGTRAVVESFIAGGSGRLRYVFEPRQGVSYGRNAGITATSAPIIAFFDDDVRVDPDWIRTLKQALDDHPEVDYVGGKVLPDWETPPAAWLTEAHWSPLAIVDYGREPLYVSSERQLCLVSANLAVRRSLFDAVGLFAPELQRVKGSIGSMEDHELLLRCWRAGKQGLYVPALLARTTVPANRMTKDYHRRWHTGHGVFCAMLRYVEMIDQDGRYVGQPLGSDQVTLFGVPAYLFRQAAHEGRMWMLKTIRRQQALALMYENNFRFLVSYIRTRCHHERAQHGRSAVAEVGIFATSLMRKKMRTAVAGGSRRPA
jgi:glycosyltransferase involved in cell wall biosynthesis